MFIKKYYKNFLLFLILITLIPLTSCKKTSNIAFCNFTEEVFISEVQTDTLSLNYFLAHPKDFGIKNDTISLGEYSYENLLKKLSISENYLDTLGKYKLDKLNKDEILLHKILSNYLKDQLLYKDFFYYDEPLTPTTGIQAQLPILLAEYNFYTKEDIETYINLIAHVYNYFSDICKFEIEKSKLGLFMNNDCVDKIVEQCNLFTLNPSENILIEIFNDKIDKYPSLSKEEIAIYKKANKENIINHLVPAYELLSQTLVDLKSTNKNDKGLFYFQDGKEYYEFLLKNKTGINKDMPSIIKLLDSSILNYSNKARALFAYDNSLLDKFINFKEFPITEPSLILKDLENKLSTDFPLAVPANCSIKYIPPSLSSYLSPAMYLIPAIDNYTENVIYINKSSASSNIYTTIAHEGYPGHLYQNVYFRHNNPFLLRNILSFPGYTEGWATYVELFSYGLSGIDANLASFLAYNELILLCIYARADIGIHYEGWDIDVTSDFIRAFAIDEKFADTIYKVLLEEPTSYLPYAIGCLEILSLKESAKSSLKEDFKLIDFHKFLLDIGPAQFFVIEEELDTWINNQTKLK